MQMQKRSRLGVERYDFRTSTFLCDRFACYREVGCVQERQGCWRGGAVATGCDGGYVGEGKAEATRSLDGQPHV